ncbi:cell division protein FtsB [Marinicella gelatinilytica]|uniref:cell division protein FtsB n=1 Tax=Marinicella gelatinilytica TaxID=2996017 RepID=UPI002260F293|nr:cell division protein FtsB [Marinicella gelatinilytica]MCX7545895.1 cell division protein FtsB [Marinicella gelatinilytica]
MKWLNGVLVLLLILALWQWQFGDGGRQDLREKQQQLMDQQAQIDELERRNDQLAAEVASLKTGLEAIEERARSELGMIKEGETFIQVVNPPDSQD